MITTSESDFFTPSNECQSSRPGQQSLTEKGYVNTCTELLSDAQASQCKALKLWLLIGLGRLWADNNEARWQAIRLVAYVKILEEIDDSVPEVLQF